MTEENRKVTVRAKNFSQIYELRREDFIKIITTNSKDYVKLYFDLKNDPLIKKGNILYDSW